MRTPRAAIHKLIVTLCALAALALAPGGAWAQPRDYSQAELDSLLAPVALYPDALLSQVLMAATYPVEVLAAARWSRANPGLQGEAAVQAVQAQDWDPSVKSMVAFPHLLQRMGENFGWTRELGAAFLAQEPQVMDTIQQLRYRARAGGHLASDTRIRVLEYDRVIVIEPADPQLVYLPYYDARVVYGTWWWPAHPPVAWAPWPGYVVQPHRPGIAAAWFWGPAIRLSLGFFFGAPDWQQRQVRVAAGHGHYAHARMPGRAARFDRPQPDRWQHFHLRRQDRDQRRMEDRSRLAPARAPREDRALRQARRQIPAPRAETPRPLARPGIVRARPKRSTALGIAAPQGVEPARVHAPNPRPSPRPSASPAVRRAPLSATPGAAPERRRDRAGFAAVPRPRAGMRPPAGRGVRPALAGSEPLLRHPNARPSGAPRAAPRQRHR
jgi:hypothetical protein